MHTPSYLYFYLPDNSADVSMSQSFPLGIRFFGNPATIRHAVDAYSSVMVGEPDGGYPVPDARFA
jgi:hypothetical protein